MATQATTYTCIANSQNPNVRAYTPTSLGLDDSEFFLQYLYYLYSVDYARTVSGVGDTFQIEMCTNGGGRVKDWHRMADNVSSMSAPDATAVRIGWTWGTGVTSGSVNSTLGFKVTKDPVEISASLPVRDSGKYNGTLGPDSDLGTIGNVYNQVNARWDFDYPGIGTSEFEGNNGHWLAEYAESDSSTHYVNYNAAIRPRY